MKRICTICARSGSTRIKDKNICSLNGYPLLAYSIQAALKSGLFTEIVITSDSKEYLELGKKWGATSTVQRPLELATSTITKTASILHAVEAVEKERDYNFDIIVDLDVSAPLRRQNDIEAAVKLLEQSSKSGLVSAVESKATPFSNLFFLNEDNCLQPIIPKENIEEHTGSTRTCYSLNASIYAWKRDDFIRTPTTFLPEMLVYLMPISTRYDIDTIEDLDYVSHILCTKYGEFIIPADPEN